MFSQTRQALDLGEQAATTGLVRQELFQGLAGPTAQDAIIERFAALQQHIGYRVDVLELRITLRVRHHFATLTH